VYNGTGTKYCTRSEHGGLDFIHIPSECCLEGDGDDCVPAMFWLCWYVSSAAPACLGPLGGRWSCMTLYSPHFTVIQLLQCRPSEHSGETQLPSEQWWFDRRSCGTLPRRVPILFLCWPATKHSEGDTTARITCDDTKTLRSQRPSRPLLRGRNAVRMGMPRRC
jgi:hypothetical protein